MRRTLYFNILAMVGIVASLVVPIPASAAQTSSTGDFVAVCRLDAAQSEGSFAGATAAVVGEGVSVTQTVDLGQGTVYQDVLERPDGTLYFASFLELTFPATDQVEVLGAPTLTIDGVAEPLIAGTQPDPDNFVVVTEDDGTSTVLRVLFPGDADEMIADADGEGVPSYEVEGDGVFVVAVDARVASGDAGEVVEAATCLASVSTGPTNRDTQPSSLHIGILDSGAEIVKSTTSRVADQGSIVAFDLDVSIPATNDDGIPYSTAFDAVVVDTLPPGLVPVDDDGTPLTDGATTESGGTWAEASRTLTFSVGELGAGSDWSTSYEAQVDGTVLPATSLTNTVEFSASTLPGDVADEVTFTSQDSATVTTPADGPTISKVADPEIAVLGQIITFTVEADFSTTSGNLYDTVIYDELPDGLDFVGYQSATCDACTATTLTPGALSGGVTRIGWSVGDIDTDATSTVTFTYEATLSSAYSTGSEVVIGDTFDNVATFAWNDIERNAANPALGRPSIARDRETSTSEQVLYSRPIIEIEKFADSDGDGVPDTEWDYYYRGLGYTIVVTNTGAVDAYDINIRDTVDPRMSTAAVRSGDGYEVTSVSDGVEFDIPGPLAPGASVQIDYTLYVSESLSTDIENTAAVNSYTDIAGTSYVGPSASVSVTPLYPEVTVEKELVAPTSAELPSSGGIASYAVTITNSGAGTFYVGTSTDVCDRLPDGFAVVDASLESPERPSVSASSSSSCGFQIEGIGEIAAGETVHISYDVEVAGDGRPAAGLNTNTISVAGGNGASRTHDGEAYWASDSADITIVDPVVEFSKTPDSDDNQTMLAGNSSAFLLDVTNTGTIEATNLSIHDALPSQLSYPGGFTYTITPPDASVVITETGSTGDARFSISHLAVGSRLRIVLPVDHDGSDALLAPELVNEATLTMAGFTPITDQGSVYPQPSVNTPSVDKSVTPSSLAPGETATFTLDVTIPTNAADLYDVTVRDILPDGYTFTGTPVVTCVSGCLAEHGGTATNIAPQPDGSSILEFFFGDYAAGAAESTYQIVLDAVLDESFTGSGEPDAGSLVLGGLGSGLFLNRAQTYANMSDTLTSAPTTPGASYSLRGGSSTAGVTVSTANVTVAKRADATRIEVGDQIEYSIDVTNVGNRPAYEIVITDDAASGDLRDVVMGASNPSAPTDGWTASDPDIVWVIPELAAGETTTFTYVATPPPSDELESNLSGSNYQPMLLRNVAEVSEWNTTPGASGAGNQEVTPPEHDSTVDVLVYTPIIDVVVVVDNAASVCPVFDLGETWSYSIQVRNLDSDAYSGGVASAHDMVVSYVLPAGLELTSTPTISSGSNTSAAVPTASPDTSGGTLYVWNIDDIFADFTLDQGGVFTIGFDTEVKDLSQLVTTNGATVTATDASGASARGDSVGAEAQYSDSHNPGCSEMPTLVKEPSIVGGTRARTGPAGVFAGDDYTFNITIVVEDYPLSGVEIVDTLPAGIAYAGGATILDPDGSPVTMTETVTVNADGTTEIRWLLADSLVEGSLYTAQVPTTIDAGATIFAELTNSVELTANEYISGTGCPVDTICDTGSVIVSDPGAPSVSKTVDKDNTVWGEETTFTVEATIPAGRSFYDVILTDQINYEVDSLSTTGTVIRYLPNSTLVSIDSAACIVGCVDGTDSELEIVELDVREETLWPLNYLVSNFELRPEIGWSIRTAADQIPAGYDTEQVLASADDRVIQIVFRTRTFNTSEDDTYSSGDLTDVGRFRPSYYTSQTEVMYTDRASIYYTTDGSFTLPTSATTGDGNHTGMEAWSTTWRNATAQGSLLLGGEDFASVVVGSPFLRMSKDCWSALDPTSDSVPETEAGANVVCAVRVENIGPRSAYSVDVSDVPYDDQQDTTSDDEYADWEVTGYGEGSAMLTLSGAAPTWESEWTIPEVAPGETVELEINFRVDYWSDPEDSNARNSSYLHQFYIDEAGNEPLRTGSISSTTYLDINPPWIGSQKRGVSGEAAEPGEPYTWAIDSFLTGQGAMGSLTVSDTLPVGWEYVPGSARVRVPAFSEAGYVDLAIHEPLVTASTAECDLSVEHEGGDRLDWGFLRDSATQNQPWDLDYAWSFDEHPAVKVGYDFVSYIDYEAFPLFNFLEGSPYGENGAIPVPFDGQIALDSYFVGRALFTESIFGRIDYALDVRSFTVVFDAIPTSDAVDCVTSTGEATFLNEAELLGVRPNGGTIESDSVASVEVRDIVLLNKTPDAGVVADGSTAYFEIVVENLSPDQELTDVVVTDTVTDLMLLDGDFDSSKVEITAGSWNVDEQVTSVGDDRVVTFTFDRIPAGQTVTIRFPVDVPVDTQDGTEYNNTVTLTTPDYFMDLSDTGSVTVVNPAPPPALNKTMDVGDDGVVLVGEIVPVTVEAVLGAGESFIDLALVDTIGDGLEFVEYGDITCTGGLPCPTDAALFAPTARAGGETAIGWFLGDVTGVNADRTVSFTYLVEVSETFDDGSPVEADDVLSNTVSGATNDVNRLDDLAPPTSPVDLATFDYRSDVETEAQIVVAEPSLIVDKSADTLGPVQAGDSIEYTISVTNIGRSPAFGVDIFDQVNASIGAVTQIEGAEYLVDGFASADRPMAWYLDSIPSGETITIVYSAVVSDDVDVLLDELSSVDNSVDVGPYSAVVFPTADDASFDPDPVEVSIPLVGGEVDIAKFASGECSGETRSAIPGQDLDWCIVVTNPGDGTAFGVDVADVLPSGFNYVPGSGDLDGTSIDPTVNTVGTAEHLAWTLGDLEAGAQVELRYSTSTSTRNASSTAVNSASVFRSTPSGLRIAGNRDGATDVDTAAVQFSAVGQEISKTPDDQFYELAGIGGTIEWTITVNNPHETPLSELVVTDDLPAGMSFVGAVTDYPTGFETETVGVQGSGASATTPIEWTFPSLGAAESFTITVQTEVPATAVLGDVFVNHADLVSAEVDTAVENQAKARIYGVIDPPTIDKTVDRSDAAEGEAFAYTLTATIPASQDLWDVTVTDILPAGLDLTEVGTLSCVSGCSALLPSSEYDGTAEYLGQSTRSDDTTVASWWLGRVTTGAEPVVLEVVVTATAEAGSTELGELTNYAIVRSNPLDRIDDPPVPDCEDCDWEFTSPPATATVDVHRPVVVIDKDVSCDPSAGSVNDADTCDIEAGETVTFTVTATNVGDWPVASFELVDQPNEALATMVDAQSWTIDGPLAAGDSVSFSYDVTLDDVSVGNDLVNVLSVANYSAGPDATVYTDTPSDSVSLTPQLAVLRIDKDATCDPTADAVVDNDTCAAVSGQSVEFVLRVSNEGSAPAQDVEVADVASAGFSNAVMTSTLDGVSLVQGAADNTATFYIDQIDPGQTIEVRYRATLTAISGSSTNRAVLRSNSSIEVLNAQDEVTVTIGAAGTTTDPLSTGSKPPSTLAFTGTSSGTIVLFGGFLMVFGWVLMLSRRRPDEVDA